MSIEKRILNYLIKKETFVFCIKDLLCFGEYKSVAKAIERLTIKGKIIRIIQGVYYYPIINKLFRSAYPVDINDVAYAISRNNNWDIRETGSYALYKIGLDNQIPQKFIYLSSGPYREYKIDNRVLEFRNSSNKNFIFDKKISLIVQAIKAIGPKNIDSSHIINLSSKLSAKDKVDLKRNIGFAPIWMHAYIKKIIGSNL